MSEDNRVVLILHSICCQRKSIPSLQDITIVMLLVELEVHLHNNMTICLEYFARRKCYSTYSDTVNKENEVVFIVHFSCCQQCRVIAFPSCKVFQADGHIVQVHLYQQHHYECKIRTTLLQVHLYQQHIMYMYITFQKEGKTYSSYAIIITIMIGIQSLYKIMMRKD